MKKNLKKNFCKVNFLFLMLVVFLYFIQNLISLSLTSKYLICFFLIATIGMSHGAYDGQKVRIFFYKKIRFSELLFYLTYVGLVLIVFFAWYLNPKISLITFLIISSFHFGKEDLEIYTTKISKFSSFIFFLKGSLTILSSLYFKFNETNEIFNKLLFTQEFTLISNNLVNILLPTNLLLQFIFYLYVLFKKKISYTDISIIIFEIFLTLIIFNLFNIIVAFTLYFCFMHSLKNILVIASELNSNIFTGIKTFILRSLPITIIVSLALFISLYVFSNFDIFEDVIQKIIFIGLASVTLPHILLHYFLDT